MSIQMTQAQAFVKAKQLFDASGVASARGMNIRDNSQRSMAMFDKSNRLADEADVLINRIPPPSTALLMRHGDEDIGV